MAVNAGYSQHKPPSTVEPLQHRFPRTKRHLWHQIFRGQFSPASSCLDPDTWTIQIVKLTIKKNNSNHHFFTITEEHDEMEFRRGWREWPISTLKLQEPRPQSLATTSAKTGKHGVGRWTWSTTDVVELSL
jgi:hypothetical protein